MTNKHDYKGIRGTLNMRVRHKNYKWQANIHILPMALKLLWTLDASSVS
jgi:hypothetical protein